MKQTCEKTGLSYETLKFYCNQGLVPNVKRDALNRRVFSEKDITWLRGLGCLKNCNMGIQEMKEYMELCLQGPVSIPQRKAILARKRVELEREILRIQGSLDYIDGKQRFYDEVLTGERKYTSSLLPEET